MKKFYSMLALLLAFAGISSAQISLSVPNDTTTGTKQNKLAKYNTTASATSIILMATTDTTGAVGIVGSPDSAVGVGVLTISGVAPCIFDNATTPNDFVQISSGTAGDCHDTGSTTRPTSGQIIGTVFGAGGAAGTYNVSLEKQILPAASGTSAITALGSSDTISAAGAFTTQINIPGTGLAAGSIIEIRVHGVYTTTATASPLENIQINAGGTTGICGRTGGNTTLGVSLSNAAWDAVCYIQIITTGNPGTAYAWGLDQPSNSSSNGGGGIAASSGHMYELSGSAGLSYITTSTQAVSVQETATLVSGQTFTLQSIFARVY
jgi:hypothetical protein